jgi:hypothetical protein
MRPARVFRWIIRVFILILTLSVTIVSLLGGLSAVIILSNPDNIGINAGDAKFNIDYDYSGINDINFTLPFNITNAGFFDLEDLKLNLGVWLQYWHVNLTTPGVNSSNTVKIFDEIENFGTIEIGATLKANYTGDYAHFTTSNFPTFTEFDFTKNPDMLFYANLTLSLTYSLGLHSLSLGIYNISVGEYDIH